MNYIMILPDPASYDVLADRMLNSGHLLIAGTTGSGKSVLIDNILWSALGRYFPSTNNENSINFILIDPKKVSLAKYKRVPHTIGYASENDDIIKLLDRVIDIMMSRYDEMQVKNLTMYDGTKILVVIDELADLMTTCKNEVMPRLQRIAQLGRAAKIQLIAATQCPKREIIPAQLTCNFTGRVALHCVNAIESRQIINTSGAELLPQYGSALFQNSNGVIGRFAVEMVPANEINKRIEHWADQYTPSVTYNKRKSKVKEKLLAGCGAFMLFLPYLPQIIVGVLMFLFFGYLLLH